MTWSEWIDSDYNTINAYLKGNYIAIDDDKTIWNNTTGTTPLASTKVAGGSDYVFK